MNVQTLKVGKREFVLLPKRAFERLAALAQRQTEQERQDAGDVAESRRRRKQPGGISMAAFLAPYLAAKKPILAEPRRFLCRIFGSQYGDENAVSSGPILPICPLDQAAVKRVPPRHVRSLASVNR